jgi:hypothetical protein
LSLSRKKKIIVNQRARSVSILTNKYTRRLSFGQSGDDKNKQ